MITHQILPTAVQWLRAGTPATTTYTTAILYGTSGPRGTFTVDAYPHVVFFDVSTCLQEPPASPPAILAAAGKPDALCILDCVARRADLCACGGPKLGDQIFCVACAICKADVQESEPLSEEEETDSEDASICPNCLCIYYGEGFHGFCRPTCAAAKHGTICHCCYE